MSSIALDAPAGIDARLGWDPKVTAHDRKRALARELVAERLGVSEKDVLIVREAPGSFGFHTQLVAEIDGDVVPLTIRNISFRAATVVAIGEPGLAFGLDLRDAQPDPDTLADMRRHSHIFNEDDTAALVHHWTRVQAVRDADGRGTRVAAEHVRLDAEGRRGWIPDRRARYDVVDLSRDGWVITLAVARPSSDED